MASRGELRKAKQASRLLEGIYDMQLGGEMTDFEVKVDEVLFNVHRLVLAASSPYFRAMLSHNMKESLEGQVVMKEVTSSAIKICIQFMYTGQVDLNMEEVADVLHAASIMQLDLLLESCSEYLGENMAVDTVLHIRDMARTYSFANLGVNSAEFIECNLTQISGTSLFLDLHIDDITEYTTILHTDTGTIWIAIMKWIRHNTTSRSEHLPKLLRVFSERNNDLENLILSTWTYQEVQSCKVCQAILQERLMKLSPEDILLIDMKICCQVKHILRNCEVGDAFVINEVMSELLVANFGEISRRPEFQELLYGDVVLAVKGSNCSDIVKWDAIVTWTKHNKRRTKRFPDLLKIMDLGSLTIDFIQTNVRKEPLVRNSNESMGLVMDALADKIQNTSNVSGDTNSSLEEDILPQTTPSTVSVVNSQEIGAAADTGVGDVTYPGHSSGSLLSEPPNVRITNIDSEISESIEIGQRSFGDAIDRTAHNIEYFEEHIKEEEDIPASNNHTSAYPHELHYTPSTQNQSMPCNAPPLRHHFPRHRGHPPHFHHRPLFRPPHHPRPHHPPPHHHPHMAHFHRPLHRHRLRGRFEYDSPP